MDSNHGLGIIEFSSICEKSGFCWVPGSMGIDLGEILRALNKKTKAQCVSMVDVLPVI